MEVRSSYLPVVFKSTNLKAVILDSRGFHFMDVHTTSSYVGRGTGFTKFLPRGFVQEKTV